MRIHGGLVLGREDGGDGRREKNGEKEDEDEVEVKEMCQMKLVRD